MNSSFGKVHYTLLGLAVALIAAGFWMLSLAPVDNKISLNVAPVVLAFAYVVVIPAALLWPTSKDRQDAPGQSKQA